MASLDWIVIGTYLAGMLALSARLSRHQRAVEDYYLGGRGLSAGAVGISILATQSSAISFISIPAFVALRPDGGLRFVQYELALPAAMALLALWLVPALRRARFVTIYELLEQRFDRRVRRAVAALFLLGRGLATGVALYATGLVLSACLDTPLWVNLLLVGAVTVVYDLMGGMTAVVISDVIQMGVLVLALALCIACVVQAVGSVQATFDNFPAARLDAFAGPRDGTDSLWSYALGGLFLYASYYGCDQSQAQRLLATPSVRDSQRALLLNGLCRFPLILGYCALGIAAAAALAHSQPLRAAVAGGPDDALVPQLIRTLLPPGLRGLVFAGLLAAAMSSLDSALNALSASTVRDFQSDPRLGPEHDLRRARLWTLLWGVLITAFAFFVGDISKTVIEAINKVGSAVYGPVLAVFALAVAPLRVRPAAALAGLVAGFAANLLLWRFAPQVHFLWWNAIGCLLGLATAAAVHFSSAGTDRLEDAGGPPATTRPAVGDADGGLPSAFVVTALMTCTLLIAGVMWACHASAGP